MKKVEEELVGVKEIARRANVSIATVDRVLHNRTGVSEKTKEKINSIIQELDYQPNLLARRLASRKAIQFAILIPQISNETDFWQAPLNGIEQAEAEIIQYGIKLDKYFFDLNNKSSFVKQTQVLLKGNLDGVLLAPSFIEESIAFTKELQKRNIPYIFIDSDIPNQESLSFIGPDLFQTGYLAGHLINYLFESGKILLVNISKEIDNHHHLLRKEEGFRTYFQKNNINKEIVKIDIRKTDYKSIKKNLAKILTKEKDVKAIFVTNSRVSYVAHFIEESSIQDKLLIGFDFLNENIEYLKKGTIDFLICQKPQEQGYRGIMALYNKIVQQAPIEKAYFMPIDIVTKENYAFYRN
ncbi:transcriptional regulator [Adhaeribacter aerolatus]|uniref:Transcriptional regulator n=1 Tax=Adhaeribacter aerolatus TaxID=670289 RepID=A0A512AYJ1_9BACT|nr:substrate-binding domain-containing protein [Adhaeribacter aerolatus]GEO04779.1 transcriptional regulator [Adhaeribacter aerolatus]